MTPEFGAAVAAREDRHARLRRRRRDQQVRAARRRGRPARRRPPAGAQPRGVRQSRGRTCRSSAPAPPRFNDDGVTALYQHLRGLLARAGPAGSATGVLPARRRRGVSTGLDQRRARRPGALPRRDRRDRARLPRATPTSRPRRPGAPAARSALRRRLERRRGVPRPSRPLERRRPRTSLPTDVARAARRAGPRAVERTPATSWSTASAARRSAPRCAGRRCRARRSRGWRCPAQRPRRAACASCARRTCRAASRSPPGCSRSSARARTPARMFAGEGDPFRTNRRFHLLVRGPAGDPAVDRVRLGHALRPRPRPAPRHLRQGRHLRRLASRRSTT